MTIAFITKPPNAKDTEIIRLALSTFCDGSGQQREEDGTTRPGWRDFERLVAEKFNGNAVESKAVFDVLVPSTKQKNTYYGISCKTKELKRRTAIGDLATTGRVYMELSNSPAYFWDALKKAGYEERDFTQQNYAKEIGDILIKVVHGWHMAFKRDFEKAAGKILDLKKSIHLVLSISEIKNNNPRKYVLHSFDLSIPSGIIWKYNSNKCLRGHDPNNKDEALIDWYGLSGGQLKYYPRGTECKYKSTEFTLESPNQISILEKASRYFPKEFIAAGGRE